MSQDVLLNLKSIAFGVENYFLKELNSTAVMVAVLKGLGKGLCHYAWAACCWLNYSSKPLKFDKSTRNQLRGSQRLLLLGDSSDCFQQIPGAHGVGRWRHRGLSWGTGAPEKTVQSQRSEPVIIRLVKMLSQSILLAIRHKALWSDPAQPSSLRRHGVGALTGSHLY